MIEFSNKTVELILQDLLEKRVEAYRKYGDMGDYPPGKRLIILMEEIGELCQALQIDEPWSKESDKGNKYEELIDAMVVLLRWAESMKTENRSVEK